MLNSIKEKIYNRQAIDSTTDVQAHHLQNALEDDQPISQAGNLETHLQICVNARVMITCNIDVSDGLVNGSTGHVLGIIDNTETVTYILIKLESKSAGVEAKRTNPFCNDFPGTVGITHQEVQFPVKKGATFPSLLQSHNRETYSIPRLTPAWRCTIHKMQGMTLDSIVVDMSGRFSPGQASVTLSRVKAPPGLHITNFDPNKITFNLHVSAALSKVIPLPVNSH